MNLKNVDLNLLVTFECLMNEGSVTRASRKLGLSQSATSGALNRLRVMFDDPLFVRHGTGIRATPRAEALIGPVEQALELMRTLVHAPAEFDATASSRRFRIVISDYAVSALLPELVERGLESAPNVRLEIARLTGHDANAAFDSGVDAAVGMFKNLSATTQTRSIASSGYACAVGPNHPLADVNLTLHRYCGARHVLVSAQGKNVGALDAPLSKQNLSREIAVVVPDWNVGARLVRSNDLVLSGPKRTIAGLVDLYGLVLKTCPKAIDREAKIDMAWPARLHNDPGHRWLRELIAETQTKRSRRPAR